MVVIILWGVGGNGADGADFQITELVLSPSFVGFGANVSPFVYCQPNDREISERNIPDFEQKVRDLGVQHVRVFIRPDWWDRDKDPSRAESVTRVCRLMQSVGASVNLTLWGGVHAAGEEMGRRTADVFGVLIKEQKLRCVQYATLQNEPNGFDMDKKVYADLYRSFDAELRRLGIRDQIKIIAGDLLSNNQQAWFDMLARDLPTILDGYSVHLYSDYWNSAHIVQRIADVPAIVAGLPAAARKPIYLMEFGVRGRRQPHEEPGLSLDGRPLYDLPMTGTLLAFHVIEAINHGYVATCQWDLADILYDRSHMYYGVIGAPSTGFALKPCYYALKLFTQSAGAGWSTLKVIGAADYRSVAAMRAPDGRLTIFAVNRSEESKSLSIAGLPADMQFHERIYNNYTHGGLSHSWFAITPDSEHSIDISMPPLSVIALTSLAGE
ncbi:MAG TPA: hypothetical protein VFE58_18740 [Tepidisphaeraceae bacterium]|nr:hypothetical protein [Tepidisphaeraceae bacterium]